jgi:hypothetical protein
MSEDEDPEVPSFDQYSLFVADAPHINLADRMIMEYNSDAGPEAYTNSSVHTRLTSYMKAMSSVHGSGYDPRTEERLDPEIVMRVGQGKKHGRFWLGDDILDTGSTLPLNRLRVASTSSSIPISQRPIAVATLQVSIPVSFAVL